MRYTIWAIFVLTIFSLSGILIVVFTFDPFISGDFIKALFFASLFLFLWGLATLFLMNFKTGEMGKHLRRGLFISTSLVYVLVALRLKHDSLIIYLAMPVVLTGFEMVISRKSKQKEIIQDHS